MNEGTFTEGYVLGRDSSGGNNAWGDGGGIFSILLIFALMFGWGRGFGGYGANGGGSGETTINVDSAVQRGFDNQGINAKLNDIGNGIADSTYAINNGINGIQQTLCQGFSGVNTALMQQGYETRLGIQGMQAQMSQCCCDLGNAIQGVNYNLATQTNALQQSMCLNTRDIIDSQREGTNAILQFLTNEKITTLNTQLAQAQAQLSQANQTNNIINALRPCPTPSYIVPNPFCCNTPVNNCGCM